MRSSFSYSYSAAGGTRTRTRTRLEKCDSSTSTISLSTTKSALSHRYSFRPRELQRDPLFIAQPMNSTCEFRGEGHFISPDQLQLQRQAPRGLQSGITNFNRFPSSESSIDSIFNDVHSRDRNRNWHSASAPRLSQPDLANDLNSWHPADQTKISQWTLFPLAA